MVTVLRVYVKVSLSLMPLTEQGLHQLLRNGLEVPGYRAVLGDIARDKLGLGRGLAVLQEAGILLTIIL